MPPGRWLAKLPRMLATTPILLASLRLSLGLFVIGCAACSSPYRSVSLGTTTATIGADTQGQGVVVEASRDRYRIDFHVTTREATELAVRVRCPGGEVETIVGESMASYRARRLPELRHQAQRREQNRARAVSSIGAAISSTAIVDTPVVRAQANVQAEASVQAQAEPAPIELGPHDRGAQSIHRTIAIAGGSAGQCQMQLLPLASAPALRGVTGYMEVTHLIDEAMQQRRAKQAERQIALKHRAIIQADLVARGADPQLRQRLALAKQERQQAEEAVRAQERRHAQAARDAERAAKRAREHALRLEANQRRAEKERLAATRRRAEVPAPVVKSQPPPPVLRPAPAPVVVVVDPRVIREQQEYAAAILLRRRLVGEYVAGGADPYFRAKQRQARFNRQQQAALDADLALQVTIKAQRERTRRHQEELIADLATRETLVAWLIARGADPEYRRKQNEADLLSFEERSRRARLDAQHQASLRLAESSYQHEVSGSGSVSVGLGTIPKPATPTEVRPPQPSSQSSWIAGFHQWQRGAWIWVPGVWSTPPVQDAVWVPSVEIHLGGQLIIRPGSWRTRAGKRVGGHPSPRQAPKVRDHRR